ncbi:uroporphyrinogen decarboxylase (URO-D) [Oxobacter pfennigii]|uniref:Uroporphyrinogen decarboxylase (URO-D) n=1 Tax=Oxobacter pfennigii TaxID=36849 RepID=A0A0P8W6F2_9CLOT|nr:uroporphyrinogen decarboxylase family protein [Oxobacter pfennigii]KPU44271.1 uroporphyrinogen decarboxylase (URO-D) [Oxobacter pfennigii]
MSDVKELQQERIGIFNDVHDNKVPKRVPVNLSLSFEATAQFAGIDIAAAQWKPSLASEAAEKVCQTLYSDSCPTGGSLRFPSFYEILKSQSFIMGSNGFIQHPEVVGMDPEDYDYLIENPYDCLLERVIPRQYKALNLNDPISMAISLTKSYLAYQADMGEAMGNVIPLVQKYGYYPGNPGGFAEAPFDYLADQLRSFKGINMDIRRIPDKVAAACDALYPILLKKGMPSVITKYSRVTYPLHMPTFMREKDFEKLWWPSFKRLCDTYASMGVGNQLWCEDNWTRYIDYLYELPTNTVLIFEYGDMKQIKEKLGKKHIITGLFPLALLKAGTKQQCIDKAKEMLDILAPGGKYIFSLDKIVISINEREMENLSAVAEYVRDNGKYSNAGETAGMEFNKEDYKTDMGRAFESKYYSTWEQYKNMNNRTSDIGKDKLQGLEERLFQYFTSLLI